LHLVASMIEEFTALGYVSNFVYKETVWLLMQVAWNLMKILKNARNVAIHLIIVIKVKVSPTTGGRDGPRGSG